jgi:hypothetical protein
VLVDLFPGNYAARLLNYQKEFSMKRATLGTGLRTRRTFMEVNMLVFWRKVGMWLLFVILLIACSRVSSEPVALEQAEPAGVEESEPAVEAAGAEEIAAPAGARLQFIEFYADW